MKILVIGNILVNYRSQALLEFLIKKNFQFQWLNKDIFTVKRNRNSISGKIIRKFHKSAGSFLYALIEFIYIIKSDLVYILPMNHDSLLRFYIIRLFQKKIITDFYVSLYDTYVLDRKKYKENSIKALKLKYLDRLAIEKSDKVIFLNRNEREYYTQLVGGSNIEGNIEFIPLYVPEGSLAKLPYLNGLIDIPTICWWGTFLNLHGIESIISAVEILSIKDFKAKFYLFGVNNDQAKRYMAILSDKHLGNYLIFKTDLTFEKGLKEFLIENCDLAIGNFGSNDKASNVLINKILDACAMRIPVLTINNEAVKEFFNSDSIYLCDNKPEEIAKNIENILSNKTRTIKVAQGGYTIYLSNFTKEKYFERLENLFTNI